ncbi:serine/threonine-protein kinase [Nocardia sp. NPDC050630]|uniref:serine/threonine-protein kinase n=1 Tax=Nocardia sp. NPDC050630 TaxID=3364321 RepID=UPI0037AC3956
MDIAEGTTFAGYRIERRLGADDLGVTYLAQHPRLPRRDALKVLSDEYADKPDFRARFLREAEVAARLQHPNVVAVRDCGAQDGRLWVAMQYMGGVDVDELIRRGRTELNVERAVRIVVEAARGLDEIHRAGLLHRDVRPGSILVAEQADGPERVLIADFGIARDVGDVTTVAGGGGMPGTVAYTAPEQINGAAVDDRADVYSLGCTLYHMLTGSVPFRRDSPGAVMHAHLNEPPPRPSRGNPSVPTAFDSVIAKAMAKQPQDRYPSCGALATAATAALLPASETMVVPAPASCGPDRRRLLLLGAVVVAIAVVAVTVSAVHRISRNEPATSAASGPSTSVDRAAAASAAAWSPHAVVFEAFSDLLPATPLGIGYRELHDCKFLDQQGNPISFDTRAPIDRLNCTGDQDPMEQIILTCNTDRSAMKPVGPQERPEGAERWTRPSGAGELHWGNYTSRLGGALGELEVSFESPNRNFCRLRVIGAQSGADLRTRWWLDAPL